MKQTRASLVEILECMYFRYLTLGGILQFHADSKNLLLEIHQHANSP